MDQRIGNFIEPTLRYPLRLTLYPDESPVRWAQCGATAELYTSYYRSLQESSDLADSISYVSNELVENAVKFNTKGPIFLSAGLSEEDWVFSVENSFAPERQEALLEALNALVVEDPMELLVKRVEENAENPERGASGLGFLTMMTDYNVRFGWRIYERDNAPRLITLARMARTL